MSTTLSTIPGVTTYASKAAALSGAVDSGAAFNTWMRAQTTGVVVLWDGWIYVANMAADYLQCSPDLDGVSTYHRLKDGTTSGGAVWATKTTASPGMQNGNAVATVSSVHSNLYFTQNATNNGLEFDFNYQVAGSQSHDDTTWGWAVGFRPVGLNVLSISGTTFGNGRTCCVWGFACVAVSVTGSTATFAARELAQNHGGFQLDGCSAVTVSGNTIVNAGDDAIAVVTDEPSNAVNFFKGVLTNWTGANCTSATLTNNTFTACYQAYRVLTLLKTMGTVLIDGLAGSVTGYFLNMTNDTGVAGTITVDTLIFRNSTLTNSGAFPSSYPLARIRVAATTTLMQIEFDTIAVVVADGAGINSVTNPVGVSMFTMLNGTGLPASIILHSAQQTTNLVTDNFNRANSATVGNGWTADGSGIFSIASNKLHVAVDALTAHTLSRPGAADVMVQVQAVAAVASYNQLVIFLRNGYAYVFDNSTAPAGVAMTVKNFTGGAVSTPTIAQYDGGSAPGAGVVCIAACVGSFILGGFYNVTNGHWVIGLTCMVDTTYAAAGVCGFADYLSANAIDVTNIQVDAFPSALATLSATPSGTDVSLAFTKPGASSFTVARDGATAVTQTSPKLYVGDFSFSHNYVVQAFDASSNLTAKSSVSITGASLRNRLEQLFGRNRGRS